METKTPPQIIDYLMCKNATLILKFMSCHSVVLKKKKKQAAHPSPLLSEGTSATLLLHSDQPVHCDVFPCKVLIKTDVWFL